MLIMFMPSRWACHSLFDLRNETRGTEGHWGASMPLMQEWGSGGGMVTGYEYKVVELREGLLGGKMSGDKLEKILNDQADDGWQLKAITAVEVKGRVGPGGVDGVLVTFERPRG